MIGASARIPSRPAAHDRPHKQAGHMTAPTSRQKDVAHLLRNGDRPHMTAGLYQAFVIPGTKWKAPGGAAPVGAHGDKGVTKMSYRIFLAGASGAIGTRLTTLL